jgi:hypothetical protein
VTVDAATARDSDTSTISQVDDVIEATEIGQLAIHGDQRHGLDTEGAGYRT